MYSLGPQFLMMTLVICTVASIYGSQQSLPICFYNQSCVKLTKDMESRKVSVEHLCQCDRGCRTEWNELLGHTVTWTDERNSSLKIQMVLCYYQQVGVCEETDMAAIIKATPPLYRITQRCKCPRYVTEVYEKIEYSHFNWTLYLNCPRESLPICLYDQPCVKLTKDMESHKVSVKRLCQCSERCRTEWNELSGYTVTWTDERNSSLRIQMALCHHQQMGVCEEADTTAIIKATPPLYRINKRCKCPKYFTAVYKKIEYSQFNWTLYLNCSRKSLPICLNDQPCVKLTKDMESRKVSVEHLCQCSMRCRTEWNELKGYTVTWMDERDSSLRIQLGFCHYLRGGVCKETDTAAIIKATPPLYRVNKRCKCRRDVSEVYEKIEYSQFNWTLYLNCPLKIKIGHFTLTWPRQHHTDISIRLGS